jgi:hypothetical protein
VYPFGGTRHGFPLHHGEENDGMETAPVPFGAARAFGCSPAEVTVAAQRISYADFPDLATVVPTSDNPIEEISILEVNRELELSQGWRIGDNWKSRFPFQRAA